MKKQKRGGDSMQIWEQIVTALSNENDSTLNNAILSKVVFKEIINNDTIVLKAPDPLTAGWFQENFQQLAVKIAEDITNEKYKIQIEVSPTKKSHEKTVKKAREEVVNKNPYNMTLDPRLTFDHFVVGPSNEFAYAAAYNVASNPGQTYNPLFVYGSVALGKTHLLQAIANKISQDSPHLKVLYITSENFTNEFIDTVIRSKQSTKFRDKYRNIDVLLIDDIQFFQEKDRTLDELFHTFNKLHQDRKQMVFACDRPPKSLSAIEDRLITRFDWGLTVEIKKPKYETRKAILMEQAEREKIDIPENVIDYIAKNIDSDVRMLSSSLTKIIAYSNLRKKDISLDLAKEILVDKISVVAPKNLSVSEIQKYVAKYFGITVNDLKSNRRLENISYPRQIAMYLSKEYTTLSLTEIGQLFGNKAHTTVMRSSAKISEYIKRRRTVKRQIDDIIASFYDK